MLAMYYKGWLDWLLTFNERQKTIKNKDITAHCQHTKYNMVGEVGFEPTTAEI